MKLFLKNLRVRVTLRVILDQQTVLTNGFGLAIDITKSGTRKEELLARCRHAMLKCGCLRRILMPMGVMDGMDFLLDKIKHSKNNSDFFDSMNT